MTYNVFGGTLSLTQSINQTLCVQPSVETSRLLRAYTLPTFSEENFLQFSASVGLGRVNNVDLIEC